MMFTLFTRFFLLSPTSTIADKITTKTSLIYKNNSQTYNYEFNSIRYNQRTIPIPVNQNTTWIQHNYRAKQFHNLKNLNQKFR